ncbi:hypothetical protein RKD20_008740 [Streptomyces sp. SLBN-8D4]
MHLACSVQRPHWRASNRTVTEVGFCNRKVLPVPLTCPLGQVTSRRSKSMMSPVGVVHAGHGGVAVVDQMLAGQQPQPPEAGADVDSELLRTGPGGRCQVAAPRTHEPYLSSPFVLVRGHDSLDRAGKPTVQVLLAEAHVEPVPGVALMDQAGLTKHPPVMGAARLADRQVEGSAEPLLIRPRGEFGNDPTPVFVGKRQKNRPDLPSRRRSLSRRIRLLLRRLPLADHSPFITL